MKKILLSIFTAALSIGAANAQLDINAFATPITTDFTGFDGSGFDATPAAGQLSSNVWAVTGLSDGDLAFGATNTTGDYARGASAGGVTSGGVYSFDNGTGASFGVQPTGSDYSPGTITMRMVNNTGAIITDLVVSYDISVLNNGDRANSWNFSNSADDITYSPQNTVDFTSPEALDAAPAWSSTNRSITLTGVNIAAGANYYIRWSSDDVSGSGSRDEIALDNISITAQGSTGPFISATPNSLSGFTQFVGTPSNEQSFTVDASNLTADITVTAPTDYEVSTASGSGFGPSVTIPFGTGTVSMIPVYVRLNGTVANPSVTGNIVLSSTGAIDENVAVSGQILTPTPFVNVTPSNLSGFYHIVGTPSTEQTFSAEGANLTADLVLTAPTDYEISTTSGAGFSSTVTLPFGSGTVSPTTIYTRLNGAAANANADGFIVATSAGAVNDTVAVSGTIDEYVLSTIASVSNEDPNGLAQSAGQLVELRGTVHCLDFDDNVGYKVTLIDNSGAGIQMFSFSDVSNYTSPVEGDSLIVLGTIGQFNGLTQVQPDSILVAATAQPVVTPTIVTVLDESTESQVITLNGLTFVTPTATWATGNVDVTDGTTTFQLRIEAATGIAGNAAPSGSFSVTGIGGQFDSSTPYTEGYQLFPCSLASIVEDCTDDYVTLTETECEFYFFGGQTLTVSGTYVDTIPNSSGCDSIITLNLTIPVIDVTIDNQDPTLISNQASATYQWIDCATDAIITNANLQDYLATANGSYKVAVTVDGCTDTSACEIVATAALNENTILDEVSVYPNPFNDQLTITSNSQMTYEVLDINGRLVVAKAVINAIETISTTNWTNGVYFLRFNSGSESATLRIVK